MPRTAEFFMTHRVRCAVIIQVANTTAYLPVTAVPDFSSGQSVGAAIIPVNHVTAAADSVWWIKRIEISVAAAVFKDALPLV